MQYICVNQINEHGLRKFRQEFWNIDRNTDQPIIPIVIDCYGGEVYSVLGMVSIIKNTTKQVCTMVDSKAMSAAAILLSCGTKGLRFASEYAHIMVHEVLTGSGNTKVSDVNIDTNHALDLNKKLFSILDNNCGKPKGFFYKQIESNKNSNLYLDAKQAKKLGIVDHVDSPTLNISTEYSIATLGVSGS